MDAHGYRQWQEADRYVKAGSKALYILVPYMKMIEAEDGNEKQALTGFSCKPVFWAQDTDGKPLEYE